MKTLLWNEFETQWYKSAADFSTFSSIASDTCHDDQDHDENDDDDETKMKSESHLQSLFCYFNMLWIFRYFQIREKFLVAVLTYISSIFVAYLVFLEMYSKYRRNTFAVLCISEAMPLTPFVVVERAGVWKTFCNGLKYIQRYFILALFMPFSRLFSFNAVIKSTAFGKYFFQTIENSTRSFSKMPLF